LKKHCIVAVLIALSVATSVVSQGRREIDRIVAVAGPDIILGSELAQQMQLTALQTNRRPKTEAEVIQFRKDVLEQMVSDKLLLQEARKDTSIHIRPEEVEQAVSEQIQRVSARFDSNDQFLAALAQEELTLRDLQKKYHDELNDQLVKQRYIQKKLSAVSVSRHEVEEFFSKFGGSIPAQPEAIKLAHLQLGVAASSRVEDSVKNFVGELRRRILSGEDFAAAAAQYSTPGMAPDSGRLGFVAKEDLVAEFGRAAFVLNDGEISGVVRTQFGYHIIKCEGRRGDKLLLRHLLVTVAPSAEDSAAVRHLADSLIIALRGGEDFALAAKTWSTDDESRVNGGELGWFALKQLPAEFADSLAGWTTPNEYRGPVVSTSGFHILKLLEYQKEKRFTMPDDFDQLKEVARQEKVDRLVAKWVAEVKAKSFVEYRLDAPDEN
jgi:peptidyl-prolyl cis-trans isomerase SurA